MKKFILLVMLTGCTTQEREVGQQCEVSCTACIELKIKCDNTNKKDNKDLG